MAEAQTPSACAGGAPKGSRAGPHKEGRPCPAVGDTMSVKSVVALVVISLAILFALQNTEHVEIQFLIWSLSVSRAVLIFALMGVGVVLGWMLRSWAYRKRP